MSLQNSRQISDVKVMLKQGKDGNGIESIEKTGTSLNVDTYTITLTDGTKYTFDVTNGTSIANIEKTSTVGNVDTYTITLTDNSTFTFTVTNAYGTTASDITYDNTSSGLSATDVQDALDEINNKTKHGLVELWKNPDITQVFASQMIAINNFDASYYDAIIVVFEPVASETMATNWHEIDTDSLNSLSTMRFNYVTMNNSAISQIHRDITSITLLNNVLSLTFGDAQILTKLHTSTTTTASTNNQRMIPVRILGLIHNN